MTNQKSVSQKSGTKKTHTKIKYDQNVAIYSYLDQHWTISQIAERLSVSEKTIRNAIARGTVIKAGHDDTPCSLIENHKYAVCNQCPNHDNCDKDKKYFNLDKAIKVTHENKHDSHVGTEIPDNQLAYIKSVVLDGLKHGRSIEVIWNTTEGLQSICSSRTIRRLIEQQVIDIPYTALRNKTKRRLKYYEFKHSCEEKQYLNKIKGGRTMTDYEMFLEEHPNALKIQLDSLVGCKTDDVKILTVMFADYWFQIAKLYKTKQQSNNVKNILKSVLNIISEDLNDDVPIVLLSDNGMEFYSIVDLETEKDCPNEVRVFFTHTYTATDKAICERNHEYFRYIVPKGKSFSELNQAFVDVLFSNINSYVRPKLKYLAPIDLFLKDFKMEVIKKLGIVKIPSNEVDLSRKC